MAAKNDPAAALLAKAAEEAEAAKAAEEAAAAKAAEEAAKEAADPEPVPDPIPEPEPAQLSRSPIESIVVTKFLASDGRLMEAGQLFVYVPKAWPVYPWTLLRPLDPTLEPALREKYLASKAVKTAAIEKNNAAVEALRQLAAKVGT